MRNIMLDRIKSENLVLSLEPHVTLFEIIYDNISNCGVVNEFISGHNHSHVWSHKKKLSKDDASFARSLRGIGIKTSQMMDSFVQRAGDFSSVGFKKTNLCNRINEEIRKRYTDGDDSALAYIIKNLLK